MNGKAVLHRCSKHDDKRVTLYGLPSAQAWCPCGRLMVKGNKRVKVVK